MTFIRKRISRERVATQPLYLVYRSIGALELVAKRENIDLDGYTGAWVIGTYMENSADNLFSTGKIDPYLRSLFVFKAKGAKKSPTRESNLFAFIRDDGKIFYSGNQWWLLEQERKDKDET